MSQVQVLVELSLHPRLEARVLEAMGKYLKFHQLRIRHQVPDVCSSCSTSMSRIGLRMSSVVVVGPFDF